MSVTIRPMTEADFEELMREEQELRAHELPMREDTKESLQRYLEKGIEPGGFLMAVLSNDLFGAFSRADTGNRVGMFAIVQYIYQNFPNGSYGSPERVDNFLKAHYDRLAQSE